MNNGCGQITGLKIGLDIRQIILFGQTQTSLVVIIDCQKVTKYLIP